MKSIVKMTLAVLTLLMIVPEPVNAVLGVRRRTARRTAVVVGTSVHAADAAAMAASQQQAAAAQQQAAAAQQQATAAQQQAAAAQPQQPPAATPAPATGGSKLPIGTVVSALPPGCVSTPVGGVDYYYGGGNFYRAVFQGNQLVYVTADPK